MYGTSASREKTMVWTKGWKEFSTLRQFFWMRFLEGS